MRAGGKPRFVPPFVPPFCFRYPPFRPDSAHSQRQPLDPGKLDQDGAGPVWGSRKGVEKCAFLCAFLARSHPPYPPRRKAQKAHLPPRGLRLVRHARSHGMKARKARRPFYSVQKSSPGLISGCSFSADRCSLLNGWPYLPVLFGAPGALDRSTQRPGRDPDAVLDPYRFPTVPSSTWAAAACEV